MSDLIMRTQIVLVDGHIGEVGETIKDITHYENYPYLLDWQGFLHLTNADNKTVCIALSQIQTMTDIQ